MLLKGFIVSRRWDHHAMLATLGDACRIERFPFIGTRSALEPCHHANAQALELSQSKNRVVIRHPLGPFRQVKCLDRPTMHTQNEIPRGHGRLFGVSTEHATRPLSIYAIGC